MSRLSAGPQLRRATVVAPANIAFIKYWGARDLDAGAPLNASISMTLSRCVARCTVELRPASAARDVVLLGSSGEARAVPERLRTGVIAQTRRILAAAGIDDTGGFRVALEVDFPVAAGLASSAAIFAAVTEAVARVAGYQAPIAAVADVARRGGSGSAARSLAGGYVEWAPTSDPESTTLRVLAPAEHWPLRDVIAVVDAEPKTVSSREGHIRAPSSPHFRTRLQRLPERLEAVRAAIAERSLERLGRALEDESIELHLIAMSSRPPIFYWRPATVAVLEAVRALRTEDGVQAYATMDAGPNVHVICAPEDEPHVVERLGRVDGVRYLIRDGVGSGPYVSEDHLL